MPDKQPKEDPSSHAPAKSRSGDDVTEQGYERLFGRHVRGLRVSRGLTQDELADAASLAADTVRRLEHGSFSPSLRTLRRICFGLRLQVSTVFASFELCEPAVTKEVLDLFAQLSLEQQDAVVRFIRAFHRPRGSL